MKETLKREPVTYLATYTVTARRRSRCKYCQEWIEKGEEIRGGLGLGYWHIRHSKSNRQGCPRE